MTIKEAMNKIKNEIHLYEEDSYESVAWEEVFDSLYKVVNNMPKWIPCSERYPKIEDEYKHFLVTDDKGRVSVQVFYVSLDEEPLPYFSGTRDIVAWMPLPEPYEVESEEEI